MNANIIGVVSQKGGVGKSALVRALAVEYARNDWSVKIADMDLRQKTTTEWNCIRMENEFIPAIAVEPFSKVKDALKHAPNYDLLIFDGFGGANSQTLEICQASDFIILPSCVSRDDLSPQIKLAHELVKKGIDKKRMCFTLSRVPNSESEKEAAIEYIKEAGYYYAGMIQERTSISQCQDNGQAANETRYPKIKEVVDNLIQNIGDQFEKVTS